MEAASNGLREVLAGVNEQHYTFNFRLMREFLYSYLLQSPIPFDYKKDHDYQPSVTYLRLGKSTSVGSQTLGAIYIPPTASGDDNDDESLAEKLVLDLPPVSSIALNPPAGIYPCQLHQLLMGLLLGRRTIIVGAKTEEAVQSLQYILEPL